MLNTLPVQPSLRQPRGIVQLNGSTVPGWIDLMVRNNTYFEADTFRVKFAVSQLPPANNAAWFAAQQETFAEIFTGFPSNPGQPALAELKPSLIYGRIDDIKYDPVATTIEITGRDLTAAFIDKKLTQNYANKRASDVATLLANSHGLTAVVTATKRIIGTLYDRDQVRMQANKSEWDLLAWLAREEGFVCYVTGQQLYFGPDPVPTSSAYVIQWQAPTTSGGAPSANALEISFSRSQTVSKEISVTARSASLTTKTAVVQSYPTAPKGITPGRASPFGATQQYFFTMSPGQKATDVQAFAERRYREIVAHEMKMTAKLPADNVLSTRSVLKVQGTGTDFDQTYFPRSVERTMSVEEGYVMEVEGQNMSAATAAAIASQ
jgi:phage protein D